MSYTHPRLLFIKRFCTWLVILLPLGVSTAAFGQWVKLVDLPERITSVHFLDQQFAPSVGLAGTTSGAIWRTEDDGKTWTKAISPLGDEVKDFAFKDALNGWACALGIKSQNDLAKTTDGGKTWTLLSEQGLLTALSYNQKSHLLFLSSWNGPAVKSNDDGSSWQPIAVPVAPTSMNGIAWLSDDVGVMSVLNTIYYGTNDAGNNWHVLPAGTAECWQPLALQNQHAILAAAESFHRLIRSDDSGKNWTPGFIFSVPITGMILGDKGALFVPTVSDGFLVSNDLGNSWMNICGPSNGSDTRCYQKGSVIFAGDLVGGLWKNATGLGNTVEPADILPSGLLTISTSGCDRDSNFFTLRSPSECGLTLDSLKISSAHFRVSLPHPLPTAIHLNDSLFVTYTPANDQPETTTVHLVYHVGTHSYDTTMRVIGLEDHHLRTSLDSASLVFTALQACSIITDTLSLAPSGCDTLHLLRVKISDSIHFAAPLVLPASSSSRIAFPITAIADTAGNFSGTIDIRYSEHGIIFDTIIALQLSVVHGTSPFLLPTSFALGGGCSGVDTSIVIINSPCDSIQILSLSIDDPTLATLQTSSLPTFVRPSGTVGIKMHVVNLGMGIHKANLTVHYVTVHGQTIKKTIIVPIVVSFSDAPQAEIQALDINLPAQCSALDTMLTIINTLCDDIQIDSCSLGDSSNFKIGEFPYPLTLRARDSLRIPVSLDPQHSGLYTTYLRVRMRHNNVSLIDSVLLRVFAFTQSGRVPLFDPFPLDFSAASCTSQNISFKIANAFCRDLTIDSVAAIGNANVQLMTQIAPHTIKSGGGDSIVLRVANQPIGRTTDSLLLRYGAAGEERDTIIQLRFRVEPSLSAVADHDQIISTYCREGSVRCVVRDTGDCNLTIDSFYLAQSGSQFSHRTTPSLPATLHAHDSLVFYIDFDHSQPGDSLATIKLHVSDADTLEQFSIKGAYQRSLSHARLTLRFANSFVLSHTYNVQDPVALDLIANDSITPSIGLNAVNVSLLLDHDAIGFSSVTPAPGWSVTSQSETSTGYHFLLSSVTANGVSAGSVLATVHGLTYLATSDTVSIALGTIQFNPNDSLFSACLLAPISVGNPLNAFLNSKCGDNLMRDEMSGRLAMSHLSIVPNPANGNSATVSFDLQHADNIRLSICDVLGRSRSGLFAQSCSKGSNSIPLELSTLPAGVYYVNIETSDDRRSLRLSIQK